ncbi:MAG: hypothetical protein FWC70_10070 [Defluviitaleaceae bacterium]|nr:hypothetical protein [Defluviitaleaceae bacterium]
MGGIGGASSLQEMSALNNLVRVGYVSDVDVENRSARVTFNDKTDESGNSLVSGWLRVIDNRPLITHEKWVVEVGQENKYEYEAHYHSHPRDLGLGENYVQTAPNPDVFTNRKVVKYEKRETINENEPLRCVDDPSGHIPPPPHPVSCTICGAPVRECPIHGVIEHKLHHQRTTVYPWLPYVGQFVLCLYLPNGEHDGVVLGGLD